MVSPATSRREGGLEPGPIRTQRVAATRISPSGHVAPAPRAHEPRVEDSSHQPPSLKWLVPVGLHTIVLQIANRRACLSDTRDLVCPNLQDFMPRGCSCCHETAWKRPEMGLGRPVQWGRLPLVSDPGTTARGIGDRPIGSIAERRCAGAGWPTGSRACARFTKGPASPETRSRVPRPGTPRRRPTSDLRRGSRATSSLTRSTTWPWRRSSTKCRPTKGGASSCEVCWPMPRSSSARWPGSSEGLRQVG